MFQDINKSVLINESCNFKKSTSDLIILVEVLEIKTSTTTQRVSHNSHNHLYFHQLLYFNQNVNKYLIDVDMMPII